MLARRGGLKDELKFLASIFDKNHERFRIVSWNLEELYCEFLVPQPGSPHLPPPSLTLHCNITVRRPATAPRRRGRAKRGHRESRDKGEPAPERPCLPGRGRPAPFPRDWPSPGPAGTVQGLGGRRRARLRFLARGWLGGHGPFSAPVAALRSVSPGRPEPSRGPWPPSASLLPGPRRGGKSPAAV
ncbi:hypothetical protein P7K49_038530 [Saguinus oedipus]|uniref:Uncharacterized protein n=1 Tax=Saguinus oedipus TaxID=9490 RepID=A0ABQ9TEY6_SAGOE|nr:hypothetical protein P7K49_038530 [Saguinus oedipus]